MQKLKGEIVGMVEIPKFGVLTWDLVECSGSCRVVEGDQNIMSRRI